ncbi:MAG: hypothetical protein A2W71_02475 [Candidatus Nealsonbacteria bacterium RIFCSPLOWO2_02_39_8]|uniref:NAD-dependent epimerase/dehydratase domain-containing protein n=1 Tax=Candidatus Nealsonbacteria bacterium RIFCSPLOWO2_02_39_8 TaxID=1801674 RepID=A0A1G2EGC4_9BACT|nr:MAG: hypothetical protein US88_C0003G0002 [Parcubacteria group bacterium GW2011_GWA2_38_27]OGZ23313.1 MAG: hypothetical protein A3E18_03030 [Candidatus Nealsonbacteria bacterium RIFCSPHIGHO2_12_FULL_38_18]OGZ24817.1 MAG: hypothetical protein A2W71_02475 [Candidatus Nealsonbacteria bacterium RIFCSPLOWO2_02_39_8]
MKKYLVTGGAGFIGSHLVDGLLGMGGEVAIIDNLSAGKKGNINLNADFYNLDICDYDKIKTIFKGIDFVFHLAAIPRVPVSIKDPVNTSRVNILGTINVFKAAIDSNVKRIVFASSSSVYGNQKKLPLREYMKPAPISPYGLQKLAGEQFAGLFTRLYGVPIVSLRYFNVYGPRIDPDSEYSLVIGKFLKQKKQGIPLTILGDGKQTRGFTYVGDIVSANIKTMESEKLKGGEIINVGQKKSNSINYLADLIGGKVQYLPPRAGDIMYTSADISLAKKLLGWEPTICLEDGLKKTIKWYES